MRGIEIGHVPRNFRPSVQAVTITAIVNISARDRCSKTFTVHRARKLQLIRPFESFADPTCLRNRYGKAEKFKTLV
jgi:hypothetical protein